MAVGIHRMLQSKEWINVLGPQLKTKYPIDFGKLEKEIRGDKRPWPANDFIRGAVEEVRAHPLTSDPYTDFGMWGTPTAMLHNSRGGVEYWDQQKAAFGSVTLDVNSSDPWDSYIAKANSIGLKWTWWRHCHNYAEIDELLVRIAGSPLKTGGLNLESVVSEGLSMPRIADMIDSVLGTSAILAIPTLGWMDGIRWDALNRHVFQLEFFLNDPPAEWADIPDVELAKQLGNHARDHCGARKVTFLCGISGGENNPHRRERTPAQYLQILKDAGERFGGIYLGDAYHNNPEKYAEWKVV